jgi:hypothetical protein
MILYHGIFFKGKESKKLIEISRQYNMLLSKVIDNLHITFQFRPKSNSLKYLTNKEVEITITGVGSDGDNNGVRVIIPQQHRRFYKGTEIPHITISLSNEGKSVNTKNLNFIDIEPFIIKGYFDYIEK